MLSHKDKKYLNYFHFGNASSIMYDCIYRVNVPKMFNRMTDLYKLKRWGQYFCVWISQIILSVIARIKGTHHSTYHFSTMDQMTVCNTKASLKVRKPTGNYIVIVQLPQLYRVIQRLSASLYFLGSVSSLSSGAGSCLTKKINLITHC